MDAIDRVLRRLERIDALDRSRGGTALLDELRQLVGEAEAWVQVEGDRRAREAVAGLRSGVGAERGVAPAERDATVDRAERSDRAESRDRTGGMR